MPLALIADSGSKPVSRHDVEGRQDVLRIVADVTRWEIERVAPSVNLIIQLGPKFTAWTIAIELWWLYQERSDLPLPLKAPVVLNVLESIGDSGFKLASRMIGF